MLIDRYLPVYDVWKHHSIKINAPAENLYRTARTMNSRRAGLSYFSRLLRGLSPPAKPALDSILKRNFVVPGNVYPDHGANQTAKRLRSWRRDRLSCRQRADLRERLCPQISSVTDEYKINNLKIAAGEKLIARASVIHAGKTQAVCCCEIFVVVADGAKTLRAAAQSTIVRVEQSSEKV